MALVMSPPTSTTNSNSDENHTTQPLCSICNTNPIKYTCPRCSSKSCSLPCSRAHKASTGCSGIRDKTAYVPMNKYGYGAMVSDYVFLEEVGRKADEWGREIVRNGIATRSRGTLPPPRSMRGGMARRGMRTYGHGQDKRSFLAMQLGFRDVYMDVLPTGMERSKRNQSFWDSKKKTALISIEFIVKPPPDPLTRVESKPVSLITHRNDWENTIHQLIYENKQIKQKLSKHEALMDWLGFNDEEGTPSNNVLLVMKRPRVEDDPTSPNYTKPAFYKLNRDAKLSSALCFKHFTEFPTIEVVDEDSFDGLLIDDDGAQKDMHPYRPKRRKLDAVTAKKTMSGLLGEYGSDEEEAEGGSKALDTLIHYTGEDEEQGSSDNSSECNDETIGVEPEGEALGSDEEGPVDDYHGLLEEADDANDAAVIAEDEDDDHWGDDEIAEDEAKLANLSVLLHQRSTT